MILRFTKEFKDILGLLCSDESQDYSPALFTRPPQKPGLIQLYYQSFPLNIGFNVHQQLNQDQVKAVRSMHQYLTMFQAVSTKFHDSSLAFDINNKRFDSFSLTTSGEFAQVKTGGIDNSSIHNNRDNNHTVYNNSKSLSVYRDNSSRNNRDTQSSQYQNPYHKPINNHNNLYQIRQNSFDVANNDYHDRMNQYRDTRHNIFTENTYDPHTDERIDDLDYADISDYVPDDVVVHHTINPMFSEHAASTIISDNNVYALVSANNSTKTSLLPCFGKLRGTCNNNQCQFSHDPELLRREFLKQMDILQKSPFNTGSSRPNSPFPASRPNTSVRFSPQPSPKVYSLDSSLLTTPPAKSGIMSDTDLYPNSQPPHLTVSQLTQLASLTPPQIDYFIDSSHKELARRRLDRLPSTTPNTTNSQDTSV